MATIHNAYEYVARNSAITLPQLTAAATGTEVIDLRTQDGKGMYMNILFQYTIAAINTNVAVRLEGSLDNVSWFHLHGDDGNLTKTANGTYAMMYQGLGEINYIRFYFVSETGGTDATINAKAKIFGTQTPLGVVNI